MKIRTVVFLAMICCASAYASAQSLTETAPPLDQPASLVAQVLLNFDHTANDQQKQQLQELINDETESDAIRTIAEAVVNFEHAVHPDYIEKLESIRDNEFATAREKTLADILLNMRHRPDDGQIARLAEID